MIPKTILLDLDDTLVPFTEFVVEHFTGSRDISGVVDYDGSLFDVCGCAERDFYQLMADVDFWSGLPMTSEGAALLRAAESLPQELMIMTAVPFARPELPRSLVEEARTAAIAGKLAWFRKHGIESYAIVTEKHPLAAPSILLIDDNGGRTARFAEHGGQALTVPKPWNDASGDVLSLMNFLCEPIAGVDTLTFKQMNANDERKLAGER